MSSLSIKQLEERLKMHGETWRGLSRRLGLSPGAGAQWKIKGEIPKARVKQIKKLLPTREKTLSLEELSRELKERGIPRTTFSTSLGLSRCAVAMWFRTGNIPEARLATVRQFLKNNPKQKTVFDHAKEAAPRRTVRKVIKFTNENIDKIFDIWGRL